MLQALKKSHDKKLVAVSTISILMTASSEALQRVSCISYPVQFEGSQAGEIRALIDSGSEVNAMTPAFAAKLGFSTQPTNVGAQKIDGSTLKT